MVLKNPVNTGRIKTLLELYPDARFVFMHRNPATTYLSSVKFFSNLFPELNLHNFTRAEIREMVIDNYVQLLNDYLKDRALIPVRNRIEVAFEDLEQRPVEIIERIYDRFGLRGMDANRPALHRYVQGQKQHRTHTYQMERKEADLVQKKFSFAFKEWGYGFPSSVSITDTD